MTSAFAADIPGTESPIGKPIVPYHTRFVWVGQGADKVTSSIFDIQSVAPSAE